jgi:hypothetical protein
MKIRYPEDKQKQILGEVQSAFGYLRRQKWTNPALGTATLLHAAIPLTDAVQQHALTVSPAFPRIVTVKGNASGITGNCVITGTNIRGEAMTETIALSGASEIAGLKAFKTVSNIQLPVETHAGTDTVSIGASDALGLDRCMAGDEVLFMTADGVYEATRPTVTFSATDIALNTVNPNSSLNGSVDFVAVFVSTERTTKVGSTA